MKQHFDTGSLFIILITFLLFTVALFVKGFTKDLLIEIGIFLVSVKLILMAYNNSVISSKLLAELEEIQKVLGIPVDKN